MSEGEQVHEELGQLLRAWRSVRISWNEVMERMTLAYTRGENLSDEDLELEDRLYKQVTAAEDRMHEFRRAFLLSHARGRDS